MQEAPLLRVSVLLRMPLGKTLLLFALDLSTNRQHKGKRCCIPGHSFSRLRLHLLDTSGHRAPQSLEGLEVHGASSSIELEHPYLFKRIFSLGSMLSVTRRRVQNSAVESLGRMMGRSTASPGMEVGGGFGIDNRASAECLVSATVSLSLNRSSGASRATIGPASPGPLSALLRQIAVSDLLNWLLFCQC